LVVVPSLVAACGTGAVAKTVQPNSPNAVEAMGEAQCRQAPTRGAPLIVDWSSHERANLEEAMSGGVAVVSFDCKKLEVLPECDVPGAYGYMGVTTKEDIVQLASSDEIQANLPLFGAKLAAGLSRGSTLDLALIQVGKRRTAVTTVRRSALPKNDRCEGATHFVRGAHIGAFAMNSGTVGKVHASAELFGMGGQGESKSAKNVAKRDGSPASCAAADTGATAAPKGCSSVLRLELIAIDAAQNTGSDAEANGCPRGLVRVGGKCTPQDSARAFDCSPDHLDECSAQCDGGSMPSCATLAYALHYGSGGVERDVHKAGVLYAKACTAGVQLACAGMGLMSLYGVGGVPRDVAKYLELTERACNAGEARGCSNLGFAYQDGKGVAIDKLKATALYERACAGGFPAGCSNYGIALRDGFRGTPDPRQALAKFELACNANLPSGCSNVGFAYRAGVGAPPDASLAVARFQRACDADKSPEAGAGCRELGNQYMDGKGVERNVERGMALYQQGCKLGDASACFGLMNLHRQGTHVPKSDLQANRVLDEACRAGVAEACAWLGDAYGGGVGVAKSAPQAIELYRKACDLQSGWGCEQLGQANWEGAAGPPDRAASAAAWEKGCAFFHAGSCHRLAWSLESGQGTKVDYNRAVALYELNCARGVAVSCGNLGTLYLTGRGVQLSDAKAAPLLERGCEGGAIWACNNAGVLHRRGGTGSVNNVRAAALFEIGCRGKDSFACFNIAKAYREGLGVPKDAAKEAEYAKTACGLGQSALCRPEWVEEMCNTSLEACTQIAYSLSKGKEPFKKDAKRGFALFQRACNAGHPNGCDGLADAYENGWGTPKSLEKSKVTRAKACSMGLKVSCR
jgi:TPR repeat protein